MVEKISRFSGKPVIVLLDGGQAGFNGLFAKLFGAMGYPFFDQGARIRFRSACLGALVNPFFQVGQRELAHVQSSWAVLYHLSLAAGRGRRATDPCESVDRLWPCIPWLRAPCARRNERLKLPAPRSRGHRGYLQPCDPTSRLHPRR